jgi:hypothetical protein
MVTGARPVEPNGQRDAPPPTDVVDGGEDAPVAAPGGGAAGQANGRPPLEVPLPALPVEPDPVEPDADEPEPEDGGTVDTEELDAEPLETVPPDAAPPLLKWEYVPDDAPPVATPLHTPHTGTGSNGTAIPGPTDSDCSTRPEASRASTFAIVASDAADLLPAKVTRDTRADHPCTGAIASVPPPVNVAFTIATLDAVWTVTTPTGSPSAAPRISEEASLSAAPRPADVKNPFPAVPTIWSVETSAWNCSPPKDGQPGRYIPVAGSGLKLLMKPLTVTGPAVRVNRWVSRPLDAIIGSSGEPVTGAAPDPVLVPAGLAPAFADGAPATTARLDGPELLDTAYPIPTPAPIAKTSGPTRRAGHLRCARLTMAFSSSRPGG